MFYGRFWIAPLWVALERLNRARVKVDADLTAVLLKRPDCISPRDWRKDRGYMFLDGR